ncbi:DNA repair protein REV1, putative [Plasmodium sp. gorilla clade G3]|nr:DNA repair protein REV1, putative [Plasmodium sp. gorilla clade G3]
MDIEYGGARDFEKYICNKEEKIPLSYNKKYIAEIEESHEKCKNDLLLFMNCNFYIDDFVSFFSICNTLDNSNTQTKCIYENEKNLVEHSKELNNYMNNNSINKTTLGKFNIENEMEYNYTSINEHNNNYYYINKIHNNSTFEYQDMDRTPMKNDIDNNNNNNNNNNVNTYLYDNYLENQFNQTIRNRYNCTPNDQISTCIKSFNTCIKTYEEQTSSSCKKNVYNSYINKKENLEILIVQNGGVIHNTLTSKVTHIISNNMALGSKKYMDYKKAIKKSKVFIVIDKYIFDCVNMQCRLPEQSYLPSMLRYNCHQITEYFSLRKKDKDKNKKIQNKKNNDETFLKEHKEGEENNVVTILHSPKCDKQLNDYYIENKLSTCNNKTSVNNNLNKTDMYGIKNHNNLLIQQDIENNQCLNYINEQKLTEENNNKQNDNELKKENTTNNDNINKHLQILNMNMDYENVKKFIICNSNEYFKRLQEYYLQKELKENIYFNVSSNLYLNKNTFEDFSRKYKILNYLSDEEIKWLKCKSELNINIKNLWENDIIHFFFDLVLRKKEHFNNNTISNDNNNKNNIGNNNNNNIGNNNNNNNNNNIDNNNNNIDNNNNNINNNNNNNNNTDNNNNNTGNNNKSSNNYNSTQFYTDTNKLSNHISEKLIDSISAYLYNSRLYILGNWNYISKELFNFDDIKEYEKGSKKFVYLYMDFDNYFLNASISNKICMYEKKKSMNNEIFCVCHSLKKEDSYGIISSTNYWGKKNKILKGMVKGEVTKMNKNINFVKYDFSNILKCSYLFLLVLINYSKNVRVLSVDESILQLFYEKEEDIFIISKKISDDIYRLTNLSVSIGISHDLSTSRKALKFCKKRFMFFDFYHHFNIFIKKYISLKNKESNINAEDSNDDNIKSNSISNDKNINSKLKLVIEQNTNVNDTNNTDDYTMKWMNENLIKDLFKEYLSFEEKRKSELKYNVNNKDTYDLNTDNIYFMNLIKGKREKEVEYIYNKFLEMNKENIEQIVNTYFEEVIHPVSKYFFFYKPTGYYFNILKNINYLNGYFISFNMYYLPHIENNSNSNNNWLNNKMDRNINKKELENNDEKKSINISVNYGVRFNKINDFYYLIYFMTKQLYLRLKIKNLKAKLLNVNFFIKAENENVNPMKYLGRGRVIRISSKIKLNQHTSCFFVYFFKVIHTFDFLANNLSDLRGVQIICSDTINEKKPHNNKKSILYYFYVNREKNIKNNKNCKYVASWKDDNFLEIPQKVNDNDQVEENVRDTHQVNENKIDLHKIMLSSQQKNEIKKKEINGKISKNNRNNSSILSFIKDINKGTNILTTKINLPHNNNNNNKEIYKTVRKGTSTRKKIKNKINRHIRYDKNTRNNKLSHYEYKQNILSYFVNNNHNSNMTHNLMDKKKNNYQNNKNVSLCSSSKTINKDLKRKCNILRNNTNFLNIRKKIKITKNYKISDFFPCILKKNIYIRNNKNIYNDEIKTYCNGNIIMHTNIFDSIINKKIKKENDEEKEENELYDDNNCDKYYNTKKQFTCCYLCYKEITECLLHKENLFQENHNCNDLCRNDIFCFTYISNNLFLFNHKNDKLNLYLYIKKIINSYRSYFNNKFQEHDCVCNNTLKKNEENIYYLNKFMVKVIDDICEMLHKKRYIDVLQNFLKNFKYVWSLNNELFPEIFQRILIKYNINHMIT